jgi:hypothetical protein
VPITRTVEVARSTGANRVKRERVTVSFPDQGANRGVGVLGVLEETFAFDDFTDGGAAVGTIQFAGSLPAGAIVLGTKVLVGDGFAGDTSAAMTIGDGTDADRYNTSTVDVFSTAADGVESGVPSGTKLLVTENRPTLTVTTDADFTSVSAGEVTVAIYYIQA